MNQLYSINEVVIRQATIYTSHNGQYKIIGVISAEEMQKLHPFMDCGDGWYYELEGFAAVTPRYTVTNHSHESFLRKIHKPSTQSFTEMMSVLKMPNKVWERV